MKVKWYELGYDDVMEEGDVIVFPGKNNVMYAADTYKDKRVGDCSAFLGWKCVLRQEAPKPNVPFRWRELDKEEVIEAGDKRYWKNKVFETVSQRCVGKTALWEKWKPHPIYIIRKIPERTLAPDEIVQESDWLYWSITCGGSRFTSCIEGDDEYIGSSVSDVLAKLHNANRITREEIRK